MWSPANQHEDTDYSDQKKTAFRFSFQGVYVRQEPILPIMIIEIIYLSSRWFEQQADRWMNEPNINFCADFDLHDTYKR